MSGALHMTNVQIKWIIVKFNVLLRIKGIGYIFYLYLNNLKNQALLKLFTYFLELLLEPKSSRWI